MNPSDPSQLPDRIGVYEVHRPVADLGEETYSIPAFPTPAFFRFLVRFLCRPTDNPMFLREWCRIRRRWGAAAPYAIPICLLLSIGAGAVLAPAVALLFQGMISAGGETLTIAIYYLALFGLQVLSAIVAWGIGSAAVRSEANRAMIVELRLTPARPEEVAWGLLAGGAIAQGAVALLPIPTLCGIPVTLYMLGVEPPAALEVATTTLFLPAFTLHMLSSQFLLASVAINLGIEGEDPGTARGLAALAGGVAVFLVVGIILLYSAALSFPWGLTITLPVLALVEIAAGCGLMHALARRLAEDRLRE